MNLPQNAYIHIPFCNSKCFYCAFISTCNLKLETGYLISLLKDIDTNYQKNVLSTLYYGGGTPSLLPLEHVKKIQNKFILDKNSEVTFEINPENVSIQYLQGLKDIGINRLSIGIQSFNNSILKLIGRKHTAEQGLTTIELAQNVGFDNISLDFIYGLPTQSLEGFINDLKTAINLGIPHISLYGLKIEENSVFGKKTPKNLPNEDSQADMYLEAINILKDFNHYEISNFAKNGYESRHNLTYWQNRPYYGFGCGAHGYENNIRYANSFRIHEYMKTPLTRDYCHFETEEERLEEEIFLGFRISKGLNINEINKKFDIDFCQKYKDILNKYIETGHIIKTDNGFRLSNTGFLISTVILAEFLQ